MTNHSNKRHISDSPQWDDSMLYRRRNMFWEQEYFSGQNSAANIPMLTGDD